MENILDKEHLNNFEELQEYRQKLIELSNHEENSDKIQKYLEIYEYNFFLHINDYFKDFCYRKFKDNSIEKWNYIFKNIYSDIYKYKYYEDDKKDTLVEIDNDFWYYYFISIYDNLKFYFTKS